MTKRLCMFAVALLLAACGNNGEAERTDEGTGTAAEPAPMGGPAVLAWDAPDDWESETPTSAMRKAQFRLPSPVEDGADGGVVVFHFPGQGGDVQSNLDRWYGQFEQPDGGPSKDAARVVVATYDNLRHTIVDLKGTYLHRDNMMGPVTEKRPGHRLLASVVETQSGPWFVKALGPEGTMDFWEKSFYEFLSSFREEAAGAAH